LHGAFHDFYWTLGEFTPGYTKLGWEGRRASDMLYYAIEEAFFKFSALAAAGVVSAIAIAPVGRREREGLFLLLGVIAIHVAGIAMQGKFFPYHYGSTLPLIALLAGLGFSKLWKRCLFGGMGGPLAFFSFVAVCVPMRYAVRDLPQFFWERAQIRFSYLLRIPPYDSREAMDRELSYVADYNLSADRAVALEVRSHTGSNDSATRVPGNSAPLGSASQTWSLVVILVPRDTTARAPSASAGCNAEQLAAEPAESQTLKGLQPLGLLQYTSTLSAVAPA
jgi:hypothetical protein